MKDLIREIRTFLKEDFNLGAYLGVAVFVTAALIYNYDIRFERTVIYSYAGKDIGYLVYAAYYILPYLTAVLISLSFKKQLFKLKKTEFWLKLFAFLGTFALVTAFREYRDPIIESHTLSRHEKYYLIKIIGELKRFIPYLLIFGLIKYIFDRDMKHFYGLRFRGIDYRPFVLMLVMMLPLIGAASFRADFQTSYPQFKYWRYDSVFGFSEAVKAGIFELAYGLDFISVELLFRGALVIGMVKVLGKEAVLPMVAAYVFIHFGKPAGEAISSFFGGFILGIHSYYKKNIFAGILIHVGIAWTMEAAAILQHIYGGGG